MAAPIYGPEYAPDILKKWLDPTDQGVSQNIIENDPELALPYDTNDAATLEGNNKLRAILGLGPSPLIEAQRKELNARDQAINAAYTAQDPAVAAEANKAYGEKLQLAGEPNRVAGESQLKLQQNQQQATRDLIESMGHGEGSPGGASGMQMSINAKGEPVFTPPKPLSQQEQSLVDAAHGINALGGPLLHDFEAKYPGIAQDPQKYGNVFADTLAPKIGKAAYMFGGMTDNDSLIQRAAAIQAWGMRALMNGRINKQMMDIINGHLPQPGFSAGANYDRLRRLLTDVLPAQLQGISEGRGPNAMELPNQPSNESDPYSDPNWGRQ